MLRQMKPRAKQLVKWVVDVTLKKATWKFLQRQTTKLNPFLIIRSPTNDGEVFALTDILQILCVVKNASNFLEQAINQNICKEGLFIWLMSRDFKILDVKGIRKQCHKR